MKKINLKIKKNKGYVLLFAVTLAAIFLSIAFGVGQIALKENNFGTSAVDTNNSFFAADTGAEQALYNDKGVAPPTSPGTTTSSFIVSGLGNASLSCAIVSATKTTIQNPDLSLVTTTSVISKGYNIGGGSGGCTKPTNVVERELDTNY